MLQGCARLSDVAHGASLQDFLHGAVVFSRTKTDTIRIFVVIIPTKVAIKLFMIRVLDKEWYVSFFRVQRQRINIS